MGSESKQTDLRQVFDDLVRFETILWNALDRRLQHDCGLSLGSLNTMLVIASTADCRVYDIASSLAITVGGASQAVDRLEAAGRCERQPNPADRRSSIVALTALGEELLAAGGAVFDAELEQRLREPLSASALTHLDRALGTLRLAARATDTGADSDTNSNSAAPTARSSSARHPIESVGRGRSRRDAPRMR